MPHTKIALAVLLSLTVPAVARAQAPVATETASDVPRPWFVHANVGVPVVSYLGTMGSQSPAWVTPANRFALVQLVGAGRWVHPNVRLNLSIQFAETLTGMPAGASPFTFMGAIAWAAYTNGPFFAGLGGVVAWRSSGMWAYDAGIFACTGVGVPLGAGFVLGAAVQSTLLLGLRLSWMVAPAILLSRRF